MQKTIILTVSFLVLLGTGLFLWGLFISPAPVSRAPIQNSPTGGSTVSNNGSTTVTPNTGTGQTQPVVNKEYLSVPGELGGSIQVKNFKTDPTIQTDKDLKHYYFVGGIDPVSAQSPYGISYTESDQSFSIVLLEEPLGDFRKLAEQELMQRLGINTVAACGLRYWVSVPTFINSTYSARNLGFSFCPGATILP